MSYAVQLDHIAKSNVESARRRLQRVEEQLQALTRAGSQHVVAAQDRLQRELQSLEKLVRAMPAENELQRKAGNLKDLLADLRAGKFEGQGQTLSEAAGRRPSELGQGPPEPERMESVRHVASFLRKSEDEVRLLAAEGTLSEELSKYPALACSDSGSTVFLAVRPWSEEDDRVEDERRRLAVLEITQAATNLQEITELMGKQVAKDQESLDAMEQQVAHTRDVTGQAVVILAEAAGQKQSQWVVPSLTLTLVSGVAMMVACPAAAAASRGVFLLGSSMVSYSTLSKVQQSVINQLKEQLPRAFQPLPNEQAKMICAGSREACARLQRKLDEPSRWTEESKLQRLSKLDVTALRREVMQKATVRYAKSDIRDGTAYVISFTAAMAPLQAFRILQRSAAAGSLDPACKVMWTRPVEAEDGSVHSIRYLAFTDWFVGRDFFCTCFCGKAPREDAVECYVMAMISLGEALLEAEGLPKPTPGCGHGRVYVSGVRLTAFDGNTKVEVMADLDPDAPRGYWTRLVDKRIRSHACDVAWLLQCELDAAGRQQTA